MKSLRGIVLGMAVLALILVSAAPVWAANDAGTPKTVGDFLASYARAMNIELPADASADTVIAALRASGVKLDSKVDGAKTLTQADVVKIGNANGVRVTTRTPAKSFTSVEIDQFFVTYGPVLAHTSGIPTRVSAAMSGEGAPRRDPREATRRKGKGKGKGKKHRSPTEPNDHDDDHAH